MCIPFPAREQVFPARFAVKMTIIPRKAAIQCIFATVERAILSEQVIRHARPSLFEQQF